MTQIHLPLSGEEIDQRRNSSRAKGRVMRKATTISFASGSSTKELDMFNDDDWELTHLVIDGANFGDGLTSFCEAFVDRSGIVVSGMTPPFGIRIGSGYFGGYVPFDAKNVPFRLKDGDSVYITVENGTDAEVSATVEWELRRR